MDAIDPNKLSVKQLKKILDSEKVSYAGLSEKHEFIAKIEELQGSEGESTSGEEEECEGPHPLMGRISEIVEEEEDANAMMWLMDSLEELVRSKRYKVCMEDIVYEALGDNFFFKENAKEAEKQHIGTAISDLLSRVNVEAREIHYDKLGPGGTKQLSGVTTRLLVHQPVQKIPKRSRKGPKSRVEPPCRVLQVIWTAFYDPGASPFEWLEEATLHYTQTDDDDDDEEEEADEAEVVCRGGRDSFKQLLSVSRSRGCAPDATLSEEEAMAFYEEMHVDLPQELFLKLVLMMVRVEEAEVMGHPWSAFLDEGDSTAHATLRADVTNILKAISPQVLRAAVKGSVKGAVKGSVKGGDLD